MLKILLLQQVDQAAFAMGSPGDEIIIQNHFTQITMVFCILM
jgi:hypothetical protein